MRILQTKCVLKSGRQRRYSTDFQYLQQSKMPTMHFQRSLPRLPIPKLERTCERYLAAQQPLLVSDAYEATRRYVNAFERNVGDELQRQLVADDKKNKHTSYISPLWYDMYLKDRKPLPVHCNPMLVFHNDSNITYNAQLVKCTNMLISSLRFYKSLTSDRLEPEVYHMNPAKSNTDRFRRVVSALPSVVSWYGAYLFNAYPLDMSQYLNLFATSRIPETDKDRIYHAEDSRHVLVQRNGHVYILRCLDDCGNILQPQALAIALSTVLDDTIEPAAYPIGALTAQDRNSWATARRNLIEAGNEKALQLIDGALFAISLDDHVVGTDPKDLTHRFLHGDATNRWYDKSFSLILSKDGVAAVNFEHSWGDGVAVLRYFQDVHKDSVENPWIHPNGLPSTDKSTDLVRRLDIKLCDNVKESIKSALQVHKRSCDSLDVDYVLIDGLGKDFCKRHSVSPDAIMQLGFQAAFYRQTERFVATYESCSTAAFKHGRTETIRPCTVATKAYCEAVCSKRWTKISDGELKSLIVNCSKVHGRLTKEAAMGQGFDRHMFALSQLAQSNGLSQPDIFTDNAYAALNHNILSTSTLSSPSVWVGAFGPVVKDGYGIGYTIQNQSLGALVTSYPPHRNGSDYVSLLQEVYEEIKNILQSN